MADQSLRWAQDGSAVICGLCIELTPVEGLYRDSAGDLWDCCRACGEAEEQEANDG